MKLCIQGLGGLLKLQIDYDLQFMTETDCLEEQSLFAVKGTIPFWYLCASK